MQMNDSGPNMKPILLLGVGNNLLTDDGIGVQTIDQMRQYNLPKGVEVIDGGIAGLDLLNVIVGRRVLIVVDAVDGDMEPGTIFRFTPDDIGHNRFQMNSLHELGLIETLRMSRLIGGAPDKVIIIGVQPAIVDWGLTLTDSLSACLPAVISIVRSEIEQAVKDLEQDNKNQKTIEETSETE